MSDAKPCRWADVGHFPLGRHGNIIISAICKHPLLVHMAAEDRAMGRILARCHGCPCHEPEPDKAERVFEVELKPSEMAKPTPPDTCPKCSCQLWDPFGFGVRMKHDIEGCLGPGTPIGDGEVQDGPAPRVHDKP